MIIHRMEQGSKEWYDVKRGKMSCSKATPIRVNGAGLDTYVKEIVLGLFTEKDDFRGKDMDRGNELEPIARMKYEYERNVTVEEVGFIERNKYMGYSPDGLVGDDGLIEIKARNNKIHFDLLINGKIDTATIDQMNMGMLISKRKWCDFISYNPNFKKNSIFIKRVYPDPKITEKLKIGLYSGQKKIEALLKNPFVMEELKLIDNFSTK